MSSVQGFSEYPQLSGRGDAPGEPQRTVMLIDDSPTVRRIIELTFERIGITVTTFPDGFSAMQALTKGEAQVPALLLLDIGMPRMDGYEVARILRTKRAFSDTIIVMLTGRDGVMDRMRSKMIGARDYIHKPFRISHVVNVVCTQLRITPPPMTGVASPVEQ